MMFEDKTLTKFLNENPFNSVFDSEDYETEHGKPLKVSQLFLTSEIPIMRKSRSRGPSYCMGHYRSNQVIEYEENGKKFNLDNIHDS